MPRERATRTSDFSLTERTDTQDPDEPARRWQLAAELARPDRADVTIERRRRVGAGHAWLLDMGEQSRAALDRQPGRVVVRRLRRRRRSRVLGGDSSAAVVLAESGHVNEALTAMDDEPGTMPDTSGDGWRSSAAYVLHHAGRLGEALDSARRGGASVPGPDCAVGWLAICSSRTAARSACSRPTSSRPRRDLLEAERLARRPATSRRAGRERLQPRCALRADPPDPRVAREQFDARIARSTTRPAARCGWWRSLHLDRAETLMHAGLRRRCRRRRRDGGPLRHADGQPVCSATAHLLHARTSWRRACRYALRGAPPRWPATCWRDAGRRRHGAGAAVVGHRLADGPGEHARRAYLDDSSDSARLVAQLAAQRLVVDGRPAAGRRASAPRRRIGATTALSPTTSPTFGWARSAGSATLRSPGGTPKRSRRDFEDDVESALDACRSGSRPRSTTSSPKRRPLERAVGRDAARQ